MFKVDKGSSWHYKEICCILLKKFFSNLEQKIWTSEYEITRSREVRHLSYRQSNSEDTKISLLSTLNRAGYCEDLKSALFFALLSWNAIGT